MEHFLPDSQEQGGWWNPKGQLGPEGKARGGFDRTVEA